jgi:hypothetical protein
MSQFRNGRKVLYLTRRPQDFKMSIFDIINGSLVGKLRLGTDKRQAFFFCSCVLAFLRFCVGRNIKRVQAFSRNAQIRKNANFSVDRIQRLKSFKSSVAHSRTVTTMAGIRRSD